MMTETRLIDKATTDFSNPSLYFNRQLSWLAFNARVLEQAKQKRHPLLERIRFLAISETNLDEFFMIRVSGLQKQVAAERSRTNPDGMTPEEELARIHSITEGFFAEQRRVLNEELLPHLRDAGIYVSLYASLSDEEKTELRQVFTEELLPILTPLAIDTSHPFPHISNLSLNLLVVIAEGGLTVRARLKVPNNVPRFMRVRDRITPSSDRLHGPVKLVRIEEVIAANLDKLFPGKHVVDSYVFQVTRDADIVIQEDEASDLLEAIEYELDRRQFGESVRLVVTSRMPEPVRQWLASHLGINMNEIYSVPEPIALGSFEELAHLDRPDLLYPPLIPHSPPQLQGEANILSAIAEEDMLLYHPFDSFVPVIEYVRRAVTDPDVLAIKQTLYRVGRHSPIVESLLEARDEETQVAVLVELKARFDEEPNIGWARQLEASGVHVAYGLVGLKTHAKVSLIVRKGEDGIQRYVHLGTGNYNPNTARVYTDFSLFTDDKDICDDVSDLFNYLTGYSEHADYKRLLVAPFNLRSRLLELINRERDRAERGDPASITLKVNSITDQGMIEALYRASQAGVRVDLIVRGICCLRPGIVGVSDNIRVVSLVGRFLEHARIYMFGTPGDEDIWLSSGDLMERNLDGRVEAAFPIRNASLRRKVKKVVNLQLRDNVNSWELAMDGTYTQLAPSEGELIVDSHAILLKEGL